MHDAHVCMIQIDPPDTISCAKEGIIDPDNVQGTGFISNQQVTQSRSLTSVVSKYHMPIIGA